MGNHYSFEAPVEQQARWAGVGLNLVLHSSDVVLFKNALAADLRCAARRGGGGAEFAHEGCCARRRAAAIHARWLPGRYADAWGALALARRQ